MAESQIHIALAGNPNCGKTTLFNLITGQNGYVGNWPGVTIEKKEARLSSDKGVVVTDLPGIYSLSPYSPEEQVSRDYLMGGEPDVVVQVVDATNLERNLYLALQVIETGLPVVVALNMADLVEKNGDAIDVARLERELGCPVVMISALKNSGIDTLIDEAKTVAVAKGAGQRHAFDSAIEDVLQHIEAQLPASVAPGRRRYYAVKLFERDSDAASAIKLADAAAQRVEALITQCEADCDEDAESIITGERYAVIAHIIDECLHRAPAKMSTSEKIDRIVTNRWLGLPIFALIMFGVYCLAISTFGTSMTDWVNDNLFGDGWELFGAAMPSVPALFEGWLAAAGASDMVISLVCDGIVAGVGAVLGFIPQMFVLFVLLSFLEDCGYMARVAFVMDRIFRRFGLSGKSFIPMLVSTGCGVPGVLATKTIENEKDRRMTAMTATFIPCGAKLPVIALVMGALIGDARVHVIRAALLLPGRHRRYRLRHHAQEDEALRRASHALRDGAAELPHAECPQLGAACVGARERLRQEGLHHHLRFHHRGVVPVQLRPVQRCLRLPARYARHPGEVHRPLAAGVARRPARVRSSRRWASIPGRQRPCPSRAWSPRRTSWPPRRRFCTWQTLPRPTPACGPRSPRSSPSAGAIAAFGAFNLLCAPCFAAMGTIRAQMNSAKWTAVALGYECGFAWVVGLMINQFYLAAQGVFSIWTAIAAACALAILFQLFRPMPKGAWDDAEPASVAAPATAA